MEIGETLYVAEPADFRKWLRRNHAAKIEIWLIQYKKVTGKPSIDFRAAIEEAMCFGWVDSYVKSMDSERYATRFSPRRPGSHWTEGNRALAKRLQSERRMTAAGRKALPPDLLASEEDRVQRMPPALCSLVSGL